MSVRTTVRQQDMSIWPHCSAIFSQQSFSDAVKSWSGIKHAIWGTSTQTNAIARTIARNRQDMWGVYTRLTDGDQQAAIDADRSVVTARKVEVIGSVEQDLFPD
jgi:hypothetical protein